MADENRDQPPARDLLGDPIDTAHAHWGRPGFKKTEKNQRLVIVLSAAKWTQERIARQIGCDVKTLRKHFSRELTEAADMLEAAALSQIMDKLCSGNMAAARKALDLAETARAIPPQPTLPEAAGTDGGEGDGSDAGAGDEAPQGKKAQQAEAARHPGAAWGNLLKH